MSYAIRLLAPNEGVPSAREIGEALRAEGFDAVLSAVPEDDKWDTLALQVPGQPAIRAERSLRRGEENPVDVEIDGFFDELVEREENPELDRVEDALRHTRQMVVLDVPDEFPWGAERTVVDALVEFVADQTSALIQADGEGFYDREGNLLVPLE